MTDYDLRPCLFGDALLAFLRAELDSPTESERLIGVLKDLGIDPVVLTEQAVSEGLLQKIFFQYRGQEAVFDGLHPGKLSWHQANLPRDVLVERTLTCRNTFESRYGTRILSKVTGKLNADHLRTAQAILKRVKAGETLQPPLLVAEPSLERLVIVEGHNRLIAYLWGLGDDEFSVPVLIGVSKDVSAWCQW